MAPDVGAYFITRNAAGQKAKLDEVVGCVAKLPEPGEQLEPFDAVTIELTPYPDEAKAQAALQLMCLSLAKACAGDVEARAAVALGWSSMMAEGLLIERQDEKTQLKIVNCIYGAGRVMDEMNKHGTVAYLGAPNWPALLAEVLPVAA